MAQAADTPAAITQELVNVDQPIGFVLTSAAHQVIADADPEVTRALQHIDAMRVHDSSPAAVAFADYIETLVIQTGDPHAVFAQVLNCLNLVQASAERQARA
ncbi:hypothetical protein ACIG63_27075 [Streptomyces antimycoticus]|uniref:hypothetical protein n=1 Tax=Streptomyces antimycoticus TaxID=68175 RepID=UPI0037D3EFB2